MGKENHINFTKAALESLLLPEGKKIYYFYDNKSRGLGIYITSSGVKTFFVYRKIQNKPKRILIGRFPEVTIFQARQKAGVINSQIDMGEDPHEQRLKKRREHTFGELFEAYMEEYAKPRKKSWAQDQYNYDLELSSWSKYKLSEITKTDVRNFHKKCGETRGIYLANRVLALVRTVFSQAEDLVGWKGGNPATGVRQFKEKSRERFLSREELPRFFKALAEHPNDVIRDYIYISLYTGARRSNVLAMKWEQISFKSAEWLIPETKNGESQVIPLIESALGILKRRYHENNSASVWVFPGRGKTGHLVEPKSAWKQILNNAEITDLRLHDLRRSLGSYQAISGANQAVISKTLHHKSSRTTEIYARLSLEPVRESMKTAVSLMQEFADQKDEEDE
jgi:integrase